MQTVPLTMGILGRLHELTVLAENSADELRRRLRRRGGYGDVHLLPYRGHGGTAVTHLRGRLLEGVRPRPPRDEDGAWENLLAAYARFESDEISGAGVVAELPGRTLHMTTDREGHFHARVEPGLGPSADGWSEVPLRTLPDPGRGIERVEAIARVRISGPGAAFGVISDVDDTILETHATRLWMAVRLTLLHNARTRKPFKGVTSFYRALERGPDGHGHNPFFYVSSGPWNLYDLLVEFMEINDLPPGPLFLQDMGLEADKLILGGHDDHKAACIDEILAAHPGLPFVLIGDTGQRDPEIYRAAAARHPGRIRAIYVRDVGLPPRRAAVERIAEGLGDVEMVLVPDSAEAARHAEGIGLLHPAEQEDVERDRDRDAAAPGPLETLVTDG